MYQTLTFLHNITRWGVLLFLLLAIVRSFSGYRRQAPFSKTDNAIRRWTATIAHIQLMIGMILYFESPVTQYFWAHRKTGNINSEMLFFSLIHSGLMITAIVLLTIGSAKAKRQPADPQKFQTIFTWFGLALVIILVAIPWPFSPFAHRPYFR